MVVSKAQRAKTTSQSKLQVAFWVNKRFSESSFPSTLGISLWSRGFIAYKSLEISDKNQLRQINSKVLNSVTMFSGLAIKSFKSNSEFPAN